MDDLNDLLWTSSTQSTKPSHSSPLTGAPNALPKYDAFSLLASSSTSPKLSYTISSPSHTPSLLALTPSSRTISPVPSSKSSTQSDPFGNLLSIQGSTNGQNLSIAERQAQAERIRREKEMKERDELKAQGLLWDQLDASFPTKGTERKLLQKNFAPAKAASPAGRTTSPFVSSPPSLTSSEHLKGSQPTGNDWDFDLLGSTSTSATAYEPSQSRQQHSDPFDFSAFDEPLSAPVPRRPSVLREDKPAGTTRSSTPGDFDFGDREMSGGLLNADDDDDEDDILGALSKPADSPASRPSPVPDVVSEASRSSPRRLLPPPHVIGQIVEMGFSPQQARTALGSTSTGLDVQAALEILLQTSAGQEERNSSPGEDERRRAYEEDAEIERRRRRRAGPSRTARSPQTPDDNGAGANASQTSAQLQEHADKLLAQASEIGLSMFNRANAFWREGKAQVQKVYEERKAASPSNEKTPPSTGRRPKWMSDQGIDDDGTNSEHGGFKGDDALDINTSTKASTSQLAKPAAKVTSLFSDDDAVYVSPARKASVRPGSRPQRNPALVKSPTPPPLRQRAWAQATPSIEASATQHRSKGTELYKLGRFADSEAAYTSAIQLLPPNHIDLIPLYNNRSAARLKTGDHKGAIDDCTSVINVIGLDYHPRNEEPLLKPGLDLGDALVKALSRRASGWEAAEKWDKARDDWEKLVGLDCGPAASRIKGEAIRAAGRCRKMVAVVSSPSHQDDSQAPKPRPRPPPKPKPPTLTQSPPSEALTRLQKANNEQESEEQERMSYKDAVDAKILAWKSGKENNLRALIASLDMVLWKEIGWNLVGMHELVTPNQVKIKYVKAIARVHPDKLNAHNTTLEHRMIANGVFGALNEAWNSFKP